MQGVNVKCLSLESLCRLLPTVRHNPVVLRGEIMTRQHERLHITCALSYPALYPDSTPDCHPGHGKVTAPTDQSRHCNPSSHRPAWIWSYCQFVVMSSCHHVMSPCHHVMSPCHHVMSPWLLLPWSVRPWWGSSTDVPQCRGTATVRALLPHQDRAGWRGFSGTQRLHCCLRAPAGRGKHFLQGSFLFEAAALTGNTSWPRYQENDRQSRLWRRETAWREMSYYLYKSHQGNLSERQTELFSKYYKYSDKVD